MYLREFSIGNFKAFGPTQTLPIKPITLIYGPNSGGKSSLIHGLLLIHEAQRTGSFDVQRAKVSGECVDLGGFRAYVFRRGSERAVEMSLSFDPVRLVAEKMMPDAGMVTVSLAVGIPHSESQLGDAPAPVGGPVILRYSIAAGGSDIATFSRRPGFRHLGLDTLNYRHPAFSTVISKAIRSLRRKTTSTQAEVYAAYEGILGETKMAAPRVLPDELTYGPTTEEQPNGVFPEALTELSKMDKEEFHQRFDEVFRLMDEADEPEPYEAFGYLDSWLQDVWRFARIELNRVVYLGPLRTMPPREKIEAQAENPDWYATGAYSWYVLTRDSRVRDEVNRWLGSAKMQTPYAAEVLSLYSPGDLVDAAAREVEPWAEPSESLEKLITGLEPREDRLFLHDKRTDTRVSAGDVGVGISQVVPVLVAAIASTRKLIAIEQPEIHLHPLLQAELGDVFIESALKRHNTFLIESHSEHLLLRILRRIRETTEGKLPEGATPITTKDVQVVYVEPTPKGSVVHDLPVTPEGDFSRDWPDGFFPERAEELGAW